MHATLLYTAAALAVGVAIVHSVLGERRLIGPILDAASPGPAVLRSSLSRRILRFAWHVTSLAWLAQAAVLAIVATFPSGAQGRPTVVVTGVSFLVIAAIAVAISRGRHVGWPLLAAVGVAALAGALM
jgi:hypothetical protein